MKKNLTFLLFFISIYAFTQINFDNGYIILNDGSKKNVLIKNKQWNVYPSEIEYKETVEAPTSIIKIEKLLEFGVNNDIYKKYEIQVDKSSTNLNSDDISQKRSPEFVTETALLKLIVDGNPQLYKYSGQYNQKLFYKKDTDTVPQQLIYKRYLVDGYYKTNDQYKEQVNELTGYPTDYLDYNETRIAKLFNKKNQTTTSSTNNTIAAGNKDKKNPFQITIKPGVSFTSMKLTHKDTDMGQKTTFRFGVELEYILGFNRNKWSLLLEPEFNTAYKSTKSVKYLSTSNQMLELIAEAKTLNIPFGARHYMFLNNNNKLYLNVLISVYSNNKINLYYPERKDILDLNTTNAKPSFDYGLGYVYKNKFVVEARYKTINFGNPIEKYNSLSLLLGYRIF